jgi:membrane-associated phospholipid phosphatase
MTWRSAMGEHVVAHQLAEWLGRHALPGFGLALGALLAATALVHAGMRRLHGAPLRSALPPAVFLVLRLGIGFGVIVAAAALFAEMMEALEADEALGAFDTRLAEVLGSTLPAGVLEVAAWATHLGDPITLTVIVLVVALWLVLRGRRWLALGWVAAGVGNGVLNQLLKRVFERVRPLHEHGFAVADGYSFPSGHTSGSVVVYGMLAYLAVRLLPPVWHLPSVLAAATLAWAMGVCRVLLQVHWASDVMAGFGSGLAWLTVCILCIEMLRRYRRTRAA